MADTAAAEMLPWMALMSGKGQHIGVGWMSHIDESGRPFVFSEEQAETPVLARSMVQIPPGKEHRILNRPVLIFHGQEPTQTPIILGIIHDRIVDKKFPDTVSVREEDPTHVPVSGSRKRRLALDAEEEIQIRVGKSAIILRRDGKIYIKGSNIVSRASQVQKIKGSAVKIN